AASRTRSGSHYRTGAREPFNVRGADLFDRSTRQLGAGLAGRSRHQSIGEGPWPRAARIADRLSTFPRDGNKHNAAMVKSSIPLSRIARAFPRTRVESPPNGIQ